MPAQTVIQVRRDTATNWSSTNPTLANGEMGYDTTNKLFKVGDGSTAWNSLKVMAQQNTGSAARPLLTDGAYLSGSGFVLSGLASNYASAPDSAALSITGDIDIKVKVAATDWTPSAAMRFLGKWGVGTRSYEFTLNTNGTLTLRTSTDGGNVNMPSGTSTVATGVSDGATKWVRATLDVNDGAGNKIYKFYTSDDGTTWTQLGTTVTSAGTTSLFDSTAELQVGASNAADLFIGTVYRTIIQSAYDTADNTTSLVFDANFETATADALAFTESSSNAATVTINTTRYTYGVPGVEWDAVTTVALSANVLYHAFFTVTKALTIDLGIFEVTSGPASTAETRMGIYATDDNFQASGAPLVDSGAVSVATSATGVFTRQFTPVTLQPGSYVTTFKTSVGLTVRYFRGGVTGAPQAMGANGLSWSYTATQSAGAFPNPGIAWNGRNNHAAGAAHMNLWRWKAA